MNSEYAIAEQNRALQKLYLQGAIDAIELLANRRMRITHGSKEWFTMSHAITQVCSTIRIKRLESVYTINPYHQER